jgi:hypothetical protein
MQVKLSNILIIDWTDEIILLDGVKTTMSTKDWTTSLETFKAQWWQHNHPDFKDHQFILTTMTNKELWQMLEALTLNGNNSLLKTISKANGIDGPIEEVPRENLMQFNKISKTR